MQKPWTKVLCSDGIQWIGQKTSSYYPENLEDASTIDIHTLVVISDFDFISFVIGVYQLIKECIDTINSGGHVNNKTIDNIKEVRSNIEDIRNLPMKQANKDLLDALKREYYDTTRGQILWFLTCYCNALTCLADPLLLESQIKHIDYLKNIYFVPLGLLMFKQSLDELNISMFVLQIRCLANQWKRLVYNENLINIIMVLETLASYFITSKGNESIFNDLEWCDLIEDEEDRHGRPLYTSNQKFLMFTEIHFRLFKQSVMTYFEVIPNHRRSFTLGTFYMTIQGNTIIECTGMDDQAHDRFLTFMEHDVLPIASNKKFLEFFSFEAIDKLVPLGLDEYRFFTNKRRVCNSLSLISEFQSGLRAKNMKTFIRNHFRKFYKIGDCQKTRMTIYDLIADILVLRCFNAFLHSHGLNWQTFFIQFENNTIMPKKSYTNSIRDTNEEFLNKDNESKIFDTKIVRQFPRIIQRFNWFDVDFHTYTWTCIRSTDAIFLWLYFVHRCLNSRVSKFDLSFITTPIFLKKTPTLKKI